MGVVTGTMPRTLLVALAMTYLGSVVLMITGIRQIATGSGDALVVGAGVGIAAALGAGAGVLVQAVAQLVACWFTQRRHRAGALVLTAIGAVNAVYELTMVVGGALIITVACAYTVVAVTLLWTGSAPGWYRAIR